MAGWYRSLLSCSSSCSSPQLTPLDSVVGLRMTRLWFHSHPSVHHFASFSHQKTGIHTLVATSHVSCTPPCVLTVCTCRFNRTTGCEERGLLHARTRASFPHARMRRSARAITTRELPTRASLACIPREHPTHHRMHHRATASSRQASPRLESSRKETPLRPPSNPSLTLNSHTHR